MRKKLFIMIGILAVLFFGFNAGAATYSDFTSGDLTLSRSGLEPVHNYTPFIQYRQFDFGHANLNDGSGVTNGSVVRLFNVTENTFIEEIGIRVTTAALYSGVSAEVGDGTDIDGFVGNSLTSKGIAFIDLSTDSSGISRWGAWGISTTGSTDFQLSGVSVTIGLSPPSGTGTSAYISSSTVASNAGPFFTSGISPYIGSDTIDMTVYTGSNTTAGSASGTTPVFEMYIRGFKRVVP